MDPPQTIRDLLEALREDRLPGAAGQSAALTAALAAALVGGVARSAAGWHDAPGVTAQAEALSARLLALGTQDNEAHERAVALLARAAAPATDDHGAARDRDRALAEALQLAAAVPLAIAEAAADVAILAAVSALRSPDRKRADAQAAAGLAYGAALASAQLVLVNLSVREDHPLASRARAAVDSSERARREAWQAG